MALRRPSKPPPSIHQFPHTAPVDSRAPGYLGPALPWTPRRKPEILIGRLLVVVVCIAVAAHNPDLRLVTPPYPGLGPGSVLTRFLVRLH